MRYSELLEQGLTPADIKRQVRKGELIPLRRGCFAWRGVHRTPEDQHLELLKATRPTLASGTVFSHVTAAVLHKLPVRISDLAKIHITRPGTSGRVSRNVWRHSAPLPDACLTEVGGVPVTTIERTVVDLGRWLPFDHAVAVVDAAAISTGRSSGCAGSFDGLVKYGRLLRPEQTLEQVVGFEKQREEVLRTHGRWTIRWVNGNLQDPVQFRRILESGFRHGPKGTWPRR